jgi:hypothetical protein
VQGGYKCKAQGCGLYWNKGMCEVDTRPGVVAIKPTVEGFSERKDLP